MKTPFECEVCGRCGGSGNFSFNTVHGTMCYGCNGAGYKLTKRGAAAKTYFQTLITKPVADVEVGEFILYDHRWVKVETKVASDLNKGMFMFDLSRKGKIVVNAGMYDTQSVPAVKTEAERVEALNTALEYEKTLTKLGKPAKNKVVA